MPNKITADEIDMRMCSQLVFGLALFFQLSFAGADPCSGLKGLSCEQSPWWLKADVEICKLTTAPLKCDKLVADGKLPAEKARDCSPYQTCRVLTLNASVGACARALVDTLGEYKDLGIAIWDFLGRTSTRFSESVADNNEFIRLCDLSVACKRELVADNPKYKEVSDTQLNKYTAAFLWVEMQSYKAYVAGLERSAHRPWPSSQEQESRAKGPAPPKPDQLAQKEKALLASAAEWLQLKNEQWGCYSIEAQNELQCYVAFMAVDPIVAAKIVGKLPWIAKAMGGLTEKAARLGTVAKVERRGHISDEVTTGVRTLDRQTFVGLYEKLEYTTVAENEAWVKLALDGPKRNRHFFDIENSKLKLLNDEIKDKSLVTALTNLHKEIMFEEIATLKKLYPNLKISPYSDFKSVRVAIDGSMNEASYKALEQAVARANQRFADNSTVRGLIRADDLSEGWFRAGYGLTADQATSAARFGRTREGGRLENFANPRMRAHYASEMTATEAIRGELANELKDSNLLVIREAGGVQTALVDRLALDLARKVEDPAKLREALNGQFGTTAVTEDSARKLQRYVRKLDQFAPGVYVPKRSFVTFDNAIHGGVSVDFVGMNARNLEATGDALTQSKTIDDLLVKARHNEQVVTKALNQERQAVMDDMISVFGQNSPLRTVCSGDDCAGIPVGQAMSAAGRVLYVQLRAEQPFPSQARVAFFQPGIATAEARGAIVAHGESLAKLIYKRMSGTVDRARLESMTIGVDMLGREVGRGEIRVIVGRGNNLSIGHNERLNLEISLRRALSDLNSELRAAGVPADYHAGGIVIP